MNNTHAAIAMALLVNSFIYNVFADIDYRCLNLCVNNGGVARKCSEQCTYGIHDQLKKKDKVENKKAPHKQFSDLHVDDKQLLPGPVKAPEPPEKNYQCAAQCQQNGMAYQLCQKHCTAPDKAMK